jgi:predicted ArsR family transcriptional regulator
MSTQHKLWTAYDGFLERRRQAERQFEDRYGKYIADELRRLHEQNEEMLKVLLDVEKHMIISTRADMDRLYRCRNAIKKVIGREGFFLNEGWKPAESKATGEQQ